jgi:hypothetical protein
MAELAVQLEQKFHAFEDIEVFYQQKSSRLRFYPATEETLRHIVWPFCARSTTLHVLPQNPPISPADFIYSQNIFSRNLQDNQIKGNSSIPTLETCAVDDYVTEGGIDTEHGTETSPLYATSFPRLTYVIGLERRLSCRATINRANIRAASRASVRYIMENKVIVER